MIECDKCIAKNIHCKAIRVGFFPKEKRQVFINEKVALELGVTIDNCEIQNNEYTIAKGTKILKDYAKSKGNLMTKEQVFRDWGP